MWQIEIVVFLLWFCSVTQVFLPSDPEYTWMLAKMFFNNAECSLHQTCTHLGMSCRVLQWKLLEVYLFVSNFSTAFKFLSLIQIFSYFELKFYSSSNVWSSTSRTNWLIDYQVKHSFFFYNVVGFTHLVCESICISVHRCLSPSHPVFRLLAPHFLYLIAINRYFVYFIVKHF